MWTLAWVSGTVPSLTCTSNGLAEDEDALHGFAAAGDHNALGDGVGVGADGDGDFGRGVAGVGDVDGDQPVAGLGGAGKDAVDGQVGQALVGIDPVGKEPGEIAADAGLFEKLLEGAGAAVAEIAWACVGAGS